jgi:O-antigen/teichoic acid export membrane protein
MLKRDITVTFGGNFIATVLSVVNSIILARVLGPGNRGLLGLALLVPTIIATFCILGQETVNATFAGLYKDKRSSLFQQSLIITLFGTVVSTLVICAFYFWLPVNKGEFGKLTCDIILLSCLVAPNLLLFRMMSSLIRGIGKITSAAIIQVIRIATLLGLLSIFLVWLGHGYKTALLLTALNPLVAVTLSFWFLQDYVTLRPSQFSGWLFKKSLSFGSQISLATFAGFLVFRVDQVILAYMVPIEQVGLYIVAVGLAEKLKLLPNSIANAFLPRLANDMANRQSQVPMVFRCTMIVSIVSMILVVICGVPLIIIVLGADYSGMIASFIFLLPGIVFLGGASVLSSDLAVREKPKYSIWVGYLTLTVNIILNFALIPLMGIAGAAVASSVSYIIACMLWSIFYMRESSMQLIELIPNFKDLKSIYTSLISLFHQSMPSIKKGNVK